jgi:NitT/TauT family transport system substrate-binding protein
VNARLGLLVVACLTLSVSPTARLDAQALPTLRIATIPNDSGAQAFYAQDEGFFKKAGLTVEITTLNSGSIITSGVLSGSFDIGQSATPSLASAHEKGLPFVVIAPSGLSSSDHITSGLVVPKDSPIHGPRDMAGKTVAVNALYTVTQFGPQAWVEKGGGDPAAMKFVELAFPEMPAAVAAHRVDAAQISEPFLEEALAQGERIVSPGYNAISPKFVLAAWFSTTAFAKANPDAIKRFQSAIMDAGRWANTHHAESARILEKYQKAPVPPQMPRVEFPLTSDPAQMQPLIDAAARYHGLKATFPAADMFLVTQAS